MAKNPARLVIIGSGSGGLPIASALKRQGADYDITVFTRDTDIAYSQCGIPFVLGGEIASFGDLLMEEMAHYTKMGIEIRTGVEVTRIDTHNNRIFVGSEEVGYDFLVIATGTTQSAPVIEGRGLIGVFPAHTKTLGKYFETPGQSQSYCAWGLHIGSVGITSQKAAEHGIRVIAGEALGISTSRYYPGAKPIYMKLLFDAGSNILIGGQVISPERGVKERIDALGMAICCGVSLEELAGFETSYSPPVAHLIDVMTEAAQHIKRQQ